jgi:hypothetical protein
VEAVAQRFALNPDLVHELLLDYEAFGWTSHVTFADMNGWALTGAGRAENEGRLSVELDRTGARSEVAAGHDVFIAVLTSPSARPRRTARWPSAHAHANLGPNDTEERRS